MLNTPRISSPPTVPSGCGRKPNGTVAATMSAVCASTGTISFSARPTISAERRSGETSMRSCAPVCISNSRFDPVVDVANRHDMTTMPGTNHCSADCPPVVWGSSGANSARKNSGCTIVKITENGSRSTGRSSRTKTVVVSVRNVVVMPRSPVLRSGRPRRRGGCGRSG